MAIGVGYLIALFGAVIAYVLSKGKSKIRKRRVKGIVFMLPISPAIAFAVDLTYAAIVKNPWETLFILHIFPIAFINGFIMLLICIFKKEEIAQPS
ncbi:hypothetical protein CSV61_16340 [Sporosarcina sp. P3]|uniref:hypothetical protein n=1 Tax=Sporosarcina sp. P3 TaxID=2048245 RepID=UPI000C16C31A|nr:hypothetical protein [Sporosarcina sp. P3]PID20121.1 hypothetical protein CSV61_16340 [Sporosarcina sp. P3]